MTIEERLDKLETKFLNQKLKIARLTGEWQGMLEAICMWDIPKKLEEKLRKKITELKEI